MKRQLALAILLIACAVGRAGSHAGLRLGALPNLRRFRLLRRPEGGALDSVAMLEAVSRLRRHPTRYTVGSVRSWLLDLAVESGLPWKELGLEPRYRSIDTGLPASLDDFVSFRWLDPVADRARG